MVDAKSDRLPDPDVIAAGAVVLHEGSVLLVHRPKYDDWAFPKGKQDPGERDTVTAVRETLEETGVEIRLGRPLSSLAHVLENGRTKIVHYWCGEVVGDPDVSGYAANAEIDAVEWVPLERVRDRLTYRDDQGLVEEALADPGPTTPLIVLRHAKARSRSRWKAQDRARPLTPTGEKQAREVGPMLAAYAASRVISSSSTRCTETVLPYAQEHVLGVHATPKLSEEDATAKSVRKLVGRLLDDAEPTVLCTHRLVLPLVFEALGRDVEMLKPAEMLVVHHRGRDVVALERH